MPNKTHRSDERSVQIGDYWLSRRPSSPNWYATHYDKLRRQTVRTSLGTEDIKEAELELAEYVVNNRNMIRERPDTVSIAEILVRYYNEEGRNKISATQNRIALAKWSDYFGDALISDLTPRKLEDFIRHLKTKNYAPDYISRTLAVGRRALNRAYQRQEIATVPFVPDVQNKGRRRERVMALEEAAAIFDNAQDHLFLFTMIAFNTLARPGAILDLTSEQINFKDRHIDLNPQGREQNKKFRPAVPISATLGPWLNNIPPGPIITYMGTPISSVRTAWRKMRDRLNLDPEIQPYTIRHTMATEMRRRGVPVWEVAGFLGHKTGSYGTTEIYAKYAPDYLSKAVEAIDAYFNDLQKITKRKLILDPERLRANCVSLAVGSN